MKVVLSALVICVCYGNLYFATMGYLETNSNEKRAGHV